MPEPAYLVLAGGLEHRYGGRWTGSNRRHREQDAAYLIRLLEEAGYQIVLDDTHALIEALYSDGTSE